LTVIRSGRVEVALPPTAALHQFTALGEEEWVPGWAPRYVDPSDGRPIVGGIWLTTDRADDGRETEVIWYTLEYDLEAGRAEYLRIRPDRLVRVSVHCQPHPEKGADWSSVRVVYAVTPLTAAGADYARTFDETYYANMMKQWQQLLDEHIARHV